MNATYIPMYPDDVMARKVQELKKFYHGGPFVEVIPTTVVPEGITFIDNSIATSKMFEAEVQGVSNRFRMFSVVEAHHLHGALLPFRSSAEHG